MHAHANVHTNSPPPLYNKVWNLIAKSQQAFATKAWLSPLRRGKGPVLYGARRV